MKKYKDFIKEEYGSKVKDDLATVMDIDQRTKDVEEIEKNIGGANQKVIDKKKAMEEELEKLQKLEITDYTPENKKLLGDKIKKYKEDIKGLEGLISNFKTEVDKLKK